jgi:hypothetical protein
MAVRYFDDHMRGDWRIRMTEQNGQVVIDQLRSLLCQVASMASSITHVTTEIEPAAISTRADTLCPRTVIAELASGSTRCMNESYRLLSILEQQFEAKGKTADVAAKLGSKK